MRDIVCWPPEGVRDVINIDADFVPDEVFWAVDSEIPLRVREGQDAPAYELSTGQLVGRFLDKNFHHYQLAVLGPSGVGKSHLIHRMRQQIEGLPGLEVLAIRRLETNLRAVLEKLIRRLQPKERARFEDDLRRAGPSLSTPSVQKSTLLDSLAQAIEEDVTSPESSNPELEEALIEALPSLVRDPYLRKAKFLKEDEVASELVDRLFSNREGKRLEERVLFEKQNLPLSGVEILNCSVQAREAIDIYSYNTDAVMPLVLAVINRNLDRAIARALNFSGDQLGELMGRIRAGLKSEGKELVILFEEFARLQGYDMAMLSALLVQGGEELCSVRWALACTSGRFRDLPDTVRTRMNLVVDMQEAPPRPDLTRFSARYLNAVRLGRDALKEAYDDPARERPNKCDACVWRAPCFDAFGSTADEIGLYPFTAPALETLARRSDADDGEKFNPRVFQKKVLHPVLTEEAGALRTGLFPTLRLLNQLGGAVISPVDRGRLNERAGGRADQYLAFYQLWNGGRFSEAPEGVMQAFGLEPISGLTSSSGRGTPPPAPTGPARSMEPVIDPDARQLAAWVGNGALDQNLAQRLRTLLFPMIERAIDWDMLGLLPTSFASATASGGNRPFRNSSIQFVRQQTTGGKTSTIRFELPLRKDEAGFTSAALALESMLKIDATGDWSQGYELEGLAALNELVEACAAEVTRQLRALRGDFKTWDPIAGAVELLLVGSALSGQLGTSSLTDEKLLEAVFRPAAPESPSSDPKLRSLFEKLMNRREGLQEFVRAHVSASKGGRAGGFIDPRPIREAARRFRRQKWVLGRNPVPLTDLYAEPSERYLQVQRDLRPALQAEREQRLAWVEQVEAAFGHDASRQEILSAAQAALDAAASAGVPGQRSRLEDACRAFAGVFFDNAVRAAVALKAADPPEAELPAYARGHRNAVEASADLISAWSSFLGQVEADIARKRAEAGVEELSQELTRLASVVDGLVVELQDLEGLA